MCKLLHNFARCGEMELENLTFWEGTKVALVYKYCVPQKHSNGNSTIVGLLNNVYCIQNICDVAILISDSYFPHSIFGDNFQTNKYVIESKALL